MREKDPPRGKRAKSAKGGSAVVVVNGFKSVRLVDTLLQALPEAGTARDRAGNRQLFYDP